MKKRRPKYRSSMEKRIVPPLLAKGALYEPISLAYPVEHRYVPDLVLPNGIVIEIKGWFRAADRAKLLRVLAAYPGLELRMVLASPHKTLTKQSKTTASVWCEKHGIDWADNYVPAHWLREPPFAASLLHIFGR